MRLFSIAIALFFVFAVTPVLHAQEKAGGSTITIAADEWCPINCRPEDAMPGIGIDLAKAAFEPLGYKIRYVLMPWTEALKAAKEGKVDAVVGANHWDEPTLVFPDNSIYNMSDDFYVQRGDSWRYQGLYTLKGKRVGVAEGYGYGRVVKQFISQNSHTPGMITAASGASPTQDNIDKLLKGRIDIVIESKPVMDYMLRLQNLDNKIIWAGGVAQDPVFVAFSPVRPNAKALARSYDDAIKSLQASGKLGAMYKAYGMALE